MNSYIVGLNFVCLAQIQHLIQWISINIFWCWIEWGVTNKNEIKYKNFRSLWGRSLANNDMISLPHLLFIKIYNRRGRAVFFLYFLFFYFSFLLPSISSSLSSALPSPGKCCLMTFPICYLLSHSIFHCLPNSQLMVLVLWWETKHYHRMTINSIRFAFRLSIHHSTR